MKEQLYICPKWKECKLDCVKDGYRRCYHNKPHKKHDRNECKNGWSYLPCPPCIPYEEKEDKPMFKVGDRVRPIAFDQISVSVIESFKDKVLPIKKISYGLNYLESDGKRQAFRDDQLELIQEDKMRYEVIKEATMVAMQKEFKYCDDYKEAMKDWIDMNYGLDSVIPIDDLISVAERHNGINPLINKGFIKKVEEEKELFAYLKYGNMPMLRITNEFGKPSKTNGDIIIDCSVLNENKYFIVNLKHFNHKVSDDEIIFTLKD